MKSLIITLSGILMILGSSTLVHGQKIMALNEGSMSVLAAASAALMVHTDAMLSGMD